MMSKVSVCIPVYNVEQYIGRCLESILRQSLKDIEIIVVNDCTPDNSMDIVRKYASEDNRIKIIEHSENHGQMVARRTGYMKATGDYITFCDSDDTLTEGALEALYNKAVAENADVVSGVIEYIPVNGKRYCWKNELSYGTDKIAVYRSVLTNEFGHNLCSRLFRREILQSYEYETYERATNGEDGMLFYQVVDHVSKVVAIDKIVYEYWQNLQSSSQVRLKEHALRSIALLNAIRKKTAGKYDELACLTDAKISSVYWGQKIDGYNIGKFYSEVGLYNYEGLGSLLKFQGFKKTSRYILKYMIRLMQVSMHSKY